MLAMEKRRELRLLLASLMATLMLLDTPSNSCPAEVGESTVAVETADLSPIRRRHEQVRKQTSLNFRQAAFVSPAPDSHARIPLTMAPLIVQQLPENPADIKRSFVRFGAVGITPSRVELPHRPATPSAERPHSAAKNQSRDGVTELHATVRQDRQTVYFLRAKVRIADQQQDQLTFVWFYPPAQSASRLRYRGVRITLGTRGFPTVWEVLSSESNGREVYVSKALEQAVSKQHDSPLPGRRFAIEPALEDQPNVVVPRVVGEGPIPMGPFVYLNARDLRITTLICRCEPSQVAVFPDSSHYRLRELDGWSDLYPGDSPPANLPLPPSAPDLESILRLPAGQDLP